MKKSVFFLRQKAVGGSEYGLLIGLIAIILLIAIQSTGTKVRELFGIVGNQVNNVVAGNPIAKPEPSNRAPIWNVPAQSDIATRSYAYVYTLPEAIDMDGDILTYNMVTDLSGTGLSFNPLMRSLTGTSQLSTPLSVNLEVFDGVQTVSKTMIIPARLEPKDCQEVTDFGVATTGSVQDDYLTNPTGGSTSNLVTKNCLTGIAGGGWERCWGYYTSTNINGCKGKNGRWLGRYKDIAYATRSSITFPSTSRVNYSNTQIDHYYQGDLVRSFSGDFCVSAIDYDPTNIDNVGYYSFAQSGSGYGSGWSGCVTSSDSGQYHGGHSFNVGEYYWDTNSSSFKAYTAPGTSVELFFKP